MYKDHPWDGDVSQFTDVEKGFYQVAVQLKAHGYTEEYAWKHTKTYMNVVKKMGRDCPPSECIKAVLKLIKPNSSFVCSNFHC